MNNGIQSEDFQDITPASREVTEGQIDLEQAVFKPAESVELKMEIPEAEETQKEFVTVVNAAAGMTGTAEEGTADGSETQPDSADYDNQYTSTSGTDRSSVEAKIDDASQDIQQAFESVEDAAEQISQDAAELEDFSSSDLPEEQPPPEDELEKERKPTHPEPPPSVIPSSEGEESSAYATRITASTDPETGAPALEILSEGEGTNTISFSELADYWRETDLDEKQPADRKNGPDSSESSTEEVAQSRDKPASDTRRFTMVSNIMKVHQDGERSAIHNVRRVQEVEDEEEDEAGEVKKKEKEEEVEVEEVKEKEKEEEDEGNSVQVESVSLEREFQEIDETMNQVDDDHQLSNIDMQNELQEKEQMGAGLANLAKTLEDGASSVIHKMEGGEGDSDQTPSEGEDVPDGTEDTGTNLKEGLTEIQTYGSGSILVGIAEGGLPDIPINDPPDKERKLSPTDEDDK